MAAFDRGDYSLIRKRMEVIFLMFLVMVGVVAVRLLWVQGVQGRSFVELANRMQGRTLEVDAQRGCIRDRNGNELAQDILGKSVAVNPRVVQDHAHVAARLAEILGLTPQQREMIQQKMERAAERKSFYARLLRGVPRKPAERILQEAKKDPSLKAVWLEDTPVRVNPSGADGIQLIGSVSTDGHGLEAIEMKLNSVLAGQNGMRRFRVDAKGEPIPESQEILVQPQDGHDVRLTIDRDIQHFVEEEVNKVAEFETPDAATALVMDIRNGDILAMANWPNYKPDQKVIKPEQRRNRAITDLFEPGSIFKVITAAAALEYKVPTDVYCS
ncbi:MAG TPA: penicillin-binding transpeptidase domain-containing protein, partial [Armatimonadota bacterium]|nr:penicillin-binding transpeptidase domain-containing protein [Armatimonadota bacterium]